MRRFVVIVAVAVGLSGMADNAPARADGLGEAALTATYFATDWVRLDPQRQMILTVGGVYHGGTGIAGYYCGESVRFMFTCTRLETILEEDLEHPKLPDSFDLVLTPPIVASLDLGQPNIVTGGQQRFGVTVFTATLLDNVQMACTSYDQGFSAEWDYHTLSRGVCEAVGISP